MLNIRKYGIVRLRIRIRMLVWNIPFVFKTSNIHPFLALAQVILLSRLMSRLASESPYDIIQCKTALLLSFWAKGGRYTVNVQLTKLRVGKCFDRPSVSAPVASAVLSSLLYIRFFFFFLCLRLNTGFIHRPFRVKECMCSDIARVTHASARRCILSAL